jgi:hypothetical protein
MWDANALTNHWSEPLAALLIRVETIEVFAMLITLAVAIRRSFLVR